MFVRPFVRDRHERPTRARLGAGVAAVAWALLISADPVIENLHGSTMLAESELSMADPRPPRDLRAVWGWYSGFRITRTEVERFGRLLNLTQEQLEASKAISKAYDASVAAMCKELAERDRAYYANQERTKAVDRAEAERLNQLRFEVGDKVAEAEVKCLNDIRAMLTPEQAAMWPRVERAERRATILRNERARMYLSAVNLDMIEMVDRMKFDPQTMAKIEARLERYEREIDVPVLRLIQHFDDQVRTSAAAIASGRADDEASRRRVSLKQLDDLYVIGTRLGEINRRTLGDLLVELDAASGDRLSAEYRRLAFAAFADGEFPFNRPTSHYVGRCFELALKFDDLSDQQRSSLAEMRAGYFRDRRTTLERRQSDLVAAESQIKFLDAIGDAPYDAIKKSRGIARDLLLSVVEIDVRVLRALRAVLTAEQAQRLPVEPVPTSGQPLPAPAQGDDDEAPTRSDGDQR